MINISESNVNFKTNPTRWNQYVKLELRNQMKYIL